MSRKLLIAIGSIALIIGAATTYRAVTGQCPIGAIMHGIHHGEAHAPATTNP